MATATDFAAGTGTTGFVPYELMEGTQALVVSVTSEMTDVSSPTDTQGGGAMAIPAPQMQQVAFSEQVDAIGATVFTDAGGTSQEAPDTVPKVYKMRGYSTTLSQYVYWSSVGDPFFPPPSEYGTVINISSELLA